MTDVDFERDLNAQQLAAATCGEGPKLVIAGAGTGKTRTLTYRVAWLLGQGVPADAILLVTFTNKAARDMVGRVRDLTGLPMQRLWGGTYHSVGARILRRHADRLGYGSSFSILDEADQRDLLRLCVTDLGIEVTRKRFPTPRLLRSILSLHINARLPLQDLLAERYPSLLDWHEEICAVSHRYRERKRLANAMDYDDLLVLWQQLLVEHPDLLERYGECFRFILVDEYQDTNLVQAEIVELLASVNGGNLMVVGDDCQSIYAFRGAHYDNILRFSERNPGTEIFRLEINYRSTSQILALTNASIEHNTRQYSKQLRARRGDGPLPALVPCNAPEQEAAFVAERILQLRDQGTPLHEIAVLYRAHSHRLAVETTLLRYDVPYEVRGGVRFFEQAHVKDVTAYLKLVANPADEVAFRRVALLQPGIGNVTANRLWEHLAGCRDTDELLARLREGLHVVPLDRRARPGFQALAAALAQIAQHAETPEEAIHLVLETGYADFAAVRFTNADSRIEDLEQLAVFATQYESVNAFLQELVLLGEMYGQDVASRERGDTERGVVLSTIHQAKGLEWKAVFIVHAVEGALPSPRALEEQDGEQEERRILYVAMTRARDELYLSYPMLRPGRGGSLLQHPSRFLQELPDDLLERWELSPEPVGPTDAEGQRSGADAGEQWDPNVDPVWDDEVYFD